MRARPCSAPRGNGAARPVWLDSPECVDPSVLREYSRVYSSSIRPSFARGAGIPWGGEIACAGGSFACDGCALRRRAGATCAGSAAGPGLAESPVGTGEALRWPKFGFCALQAATSCKSISGKGLVALRGWGRPFKMGTIQSAKRPSPVWDPPCTNPACSQAALISAQGR